MCTLAGHYSPSFLFFIISEECDLTASFTYLDPSLYFLLHRILGNSTLILDREKRDRFLNISGEKRPKLTRFKIKSLKKLKCAESISLEIKIYDQKVKNFKLKSVR